jgi:formimidoylglutamate deiminase
MAQPVGALAPGYRADIAVLDADHPTLICRSGDAVLDSWIFSGGNQCVKDVFAGGSQVVKDRHHVREDEIEAGFRAAVRRLSQ